MRSLVKGHLWKVKCHPKRLVVSVLAGCLTSFVIHLPWLVNGRLADVASKQNSRPPAYDDLLQRPWRELDIEGKDLETNELVDSQLKKVLQHESRPRNATWVGVSIDKKAECPGLLKPVDVWDYQTWQQVKNPGTYIFSAFFDTRYSYRLVRIIGITSLKDPGTRFCYLWFWDADHPQIVTGKIKLLPEHHDCKYRAIFIDCQWSSKSPRKPYGVSVVRRKCSKPDNAVVVQHSEEEPPKSFTVCVPPLNRNYDNVHQFTEMVEYNRMFGAQKFTFYNHSMGAGIYPLIQSYIQDGVAEMELVQWKIPVKTEHEISEKEVDIHYFGQIAAINDCLYRNMYKSEYILFSDLDELAVPRGETTWKDLLSTIGTLRDTKRIAAYIFRSSTFRTEWPSDPVEETNEQLQNITLLSLLKIRREEKIHSHGERSKYLANPRRIESGAIHQVGEFMQEDFIEYAVPIDLGLLHHYRSGQGSRSRKWMNDRYMQIKFTQQIVKSVRQRLNSYQQVIWANSQVPYNFTALIEGDELS